MPRQSHHPVQTSSRPGHGRGAVHARLPLRERQLHGTGRTMVEQGGSTGRHVRRAGAGALKKKPYTGYINSVHRRYINSVHRSKHGEVFHLSGISTHFHHCARNMLWQRNPSSVPGPHAGQQHERASKTTLSTVSGAVSNTRGGDCTAPQKSQAGKGVGTNHAGTALPPQWETPASETLVGTSRRSGRRGCAEQAGFHA